MDEVNRLNIDRTGDGRFDVVGEIDAHSAPALAAALEESTADTIVVDMSGVTFMDSSGLRVLLALAERSGGRSLQIAQPSRPIMRLFEVSGLVDHFDIIESDAV